MQHYSYQGGQPVLDLVPVASRDEGIARVSDGEAALMMVIPSGLSESLGSDPPLSTGAPIALVGNRTHPAYPLTVLMTSAAVEHYARGAAPGFSSLLVEEPLGGATIRSEFESYVPGLLIVAIMLSLYVVAMTTARHLESGTLRRLRLTPLTALEYLAGTSAVQVLLSVVALLSTFAVATALGFRSVGPLPVAILVASITSLSMIGIGLLVASFARTVGRALLVANLPFLLLMFFSGALFPMRRIPILRIGTHALGLWDLLPPRQAIVALNKVLSFGASLREVRFELGLLSILAIVFFGVGAFTFRRAHFSVER
jgi:ABC-2 type transport system permease protein